MFRVTNFSLRSNRVVPVTTKRSTKTHLIRFVCFRGSSIVAAILVEGTSEIIGHKWAN